MIFECSFIKQIYDRVKKSGDACCKHDKNSKFYIGLIEKPDKICINEEAG